MKRTLRRHVEVAGPVDGRVTPCSSPTLRAADHTTLEIPAGFPQLPQCLRHRSHRRCEKIRMGLGTQGSKVVSTRGSMTLKSHTLNVKVKPAA